jgi:HD-GYP domain-containing protein (c-di-GMP phosphodiesterase class II)/HAMP domain-containing protein
MRGDGETGRPGGAVPEAGDGARAFSGLQWRVSLFVAGALAVVLTAVVIGYHGFLSRQVEREAADHAGVVADTIRLSLTQSMLNRDREAIVAALDNIVHNPTLFEALIADPDGKVRHASRQNLVGQELRQLVYGRLTRQRPWTVVPGTDETPATLYRSVAIGNRGECIGCHGEKAAVLGTLGIAVSLRPAQQLLAESRNFLVGIVLLVFVLLFTLNYVFFARLVTGPLTGLVARFRQAGQGALQGDPGPPATVRDEIGLLHRHFEEMIGEIRSTHEREVAKERELVALQRDTRYQAELEDVNAQLTSRITELDEANGQINRLALQLEERNRSLEKAVKNISALNRVGVALSSELDLDRLVKLLVNISVKGLRVEVGYLMLLDEQSGRLAMRAWAGLPEGFDPTLQLELGDGVSGTVAQTGKPLLLRTVDGTQGVRAQSRYGFTRRSVLAVPIRSKGRLLGAIELANRRGAETFGEEDLEMLSSIANQAAIAIENANLYREVQKSYFDTIRALVQAVEEKDKYTRGHSERVTTFSVKIAAKMGLAAQQVRTIRYAGVLHDIGKIGIDLKILQKKERLSAEEYTVVKNHPLIGMRILEPIGFLADVLPGVSQHHERYDGFGYPRGLRGEQMAFEARILAVADAYDAMITERPYRKPLLRRDAIAELQRCSGKQFDPLVVENFIEILDNDPEIRQLEERLLTVGA